MLHKFNFTHMCVSYRGKYKHYRYIYIKISCQFTLLVFNGHKLKKTHIIFYVQVIQIIIKKICRLSTYKRVLMKFKQVTSKFTAIATLFCRNSYKTFQNLWVVNYFQGKSKNRFQVYLFHKNNIHLFGNTEGASDYKYY